MANRKIKKYHLFGAVVIFFFAALVTYINLGLTKELIGDDAGVGYHFSNMQLNLASSMWDSYTFPGRSNVAGIISLVHITIINVLNRVGLIPIVVDRLYYFLFFFISGLGLYFLAFNICRKLFPENKTMLWATSLTAALFYIFNNFTIILLSFPPTNYLYSYILLPWIFLFYYKGFHIDNNLWKRIVFAFTFLLILSGNPSNTVSIVILLLFFDFFLEKEKRIIHHWKNFSLTLALILLLSSFILLPLLGNNGNPYGQVLGNNASIAYNSLNTSIDKLLRFSGHSAQDTFVFNQFLSRNRSIIANYLLLLFSLGFLLKKRISKIEIFLFITFLLFLFLAKATHSPFSSVNEWIYSNVPFFEMYRASYYKFVFFCVFSLSILLSISLVAINEKILQSRLPSFAKIIVALFPLLLVLISATPFFSGKIVSDIHKTNIPVEYRKANEYFSDIKTDFSILSLPQLPSGLTLDWGNGNYYGSSGNPDPYLLGRPVWTNGWFSSGNPISNEFGFYKNFLGRTDVKYIFLHKDIPEKYYFKIGIMGSPKGQTNYKLLDDQISKDQDFTLIEDNKYFKIFQVNQGKYKSHFEIPDTMIVSDRQAGDLLKVDSGENWLKDSAVFFQEQNIGKEKVLDIVKTMNTVGGRPTLEYNKINSTKYRLKIHGVSKQFPLIFNESFQDGWNVYLVNRRQQNNTGASVITETWFKKPAVSNNNHLMVNSYANSWIINPNDPCAGSDKCVQNSDGSYDMDLVVEFWPQRLFYLGAGISGLTLLYCLGQLAYSLVTRKKRIFRDKK